MTRPVSHGYPDFGRFQATADKLIDEVVGAVVSAFTSHGRYFVGDLASVVFFGTVTINHGRFQLRYYDASSGGNLLAGFSIDVRNLTNLDNAMPVVGPWLEVAFTPSGANTEYSFILSSSHYPAFNNLNAGQEPILASFGGSIAAGATQTVTATRVWPGEAHWFWQTDSPLWSARVLSVNYLGAGIRIDGHTGQAAGSVGRQIFLPPTTVQLEVVNQDVAARTFVGALVARPVEPGR